MKFIHATVGQDAVIADGDIRDPMDRQYLSDAFRAQTEAGMFAVVPTGRLDACCRRGLVIEQFSAIPPGAGSVIFLRRPR